MKITYVLELMFGLIFGLISVVNSQSINLDEFNKVLVRGEIKINYIYSEQYYLQIETKEHASFVDIVVENNELQIKHTLLKPDKNKSVTINVYGGQLKELRLKLGSLINIDSIGFSDSIQVVLASGSDLKAVCNLSCIDLVVNKGSFAYLEGKIDYMNTTVRSGAKVRCNKTDVKKADVKISTGGFMAIGSTAEVSGKVSTGGELKFYGAPNKHRVKQRLKGKITRTENELL